MSRLQRWDSIIGIAAGGIVIIGGAYGFIHFLRSRGERQTLANVTPTVSVYVLATPQATALASATPSPVRPQPIARNEAPLSVAVRLRDGEQRILLGGRLGLGVTFAEVASVPIATLHINHGGVQQHEALIPAARQFNVKLGRKEYQVSVTSVSMDAREAVVHVDEVSN